MVEVLMKEKMWSILNEKNLMESMTSLVGKRKSTEGKQLDLLQS